MRTKPTDNLIEKKNLPSNFCLNEFDMTLYLNGVIEEQNGAFFYNLSHVFLFWALSRQTIFNPSGQLNRARVHVWGEKLCCEKSRDSTRSKPWINLNLYNWCKNITENFVKSYWERNKWNQNIINWYASKRIFMNN